MREPHDYCCRATVYSWRKTFMGSTWLARRAGIRLAATAVATSKDMVMA
jgi:hypothetical protein